MVSSLVALTWAQAPAGGFSQFWGPLYTYPAPDLGARRAAAARPGWPGRDASLEPHRDRFRRARSHAGRRKAIRASSASSSGPAVRAGRWPSCTSRFSTPSTPSRSATAATPAFPTRPRAPRSMPRSRRPRTTRWSRCIRRRRRIATSSSPKSSPRFADSRAKSDGIQVGQRAARAILQRSADDGSDHAEPRLGVDFFTSDRPGKWRQDPISQLPVALGAHWGDVDAVCRAGCPAFPRRRPRRR